MRNNQNENLDPAVEALKKKDRRNFLYSLVMLIGGMGVQALPNMQGRFAGWGRWLVAAFLLQLASIAIGLAIKLIRRRFKPTDEVPFSKAFWLDTVEEGFAVWCLLVVAILFRYVQWLNVVGGWEFPWS